MNMDYAMQRKLVTARALWQNWLCGEGRMLVHDGGGGWHYDGSGYRYDAVRKVYLDGDGQPVMPERLNGSLSPALP